MKGELLTRTECSAMRGIAIIGIMLHNYCHWLKDIVRENEYTWTASKVDHLWVLLQHPDELLPIHLFSFFGHYGVPVFLFLSGFGLVMKYETIQEDKLPAFRFLRYNYLKLLRILIVGFVAFTMIDVMTYNPHRYHWDEVVGILGMFANFYEHPSQVIWPGPYWYFGLTLQVYFLYRVLFYRWRHWGVVIAAIVLCWLLQEICLNDSETLERLRYNCIGGMLPFGMGLLVARVCSEQTGSFLGAKSEFPPSKLPVFPKPVWILLVVVLCCLIVAMGFNSQFWLWIPLFIVVGTVALVKVLPPMLLRAMVWVGGISAAIFVAHPIVRKLFVRPYIHDDLYAGLILYTVATIALSWLFMLIINRIPKPKL